MSAGLAKNGRLWRDESSPAAVVVTAAFAFCPLAIVGKELH